MSSGKGRVAEKPLEPLIFMNRGHQVILDADLARLYGVGTGRFNEAFKRNRQRFPADFAFQLTAIELANLRSQFAISSSQTTDSTGKSMNWSQFATSSSRHRGAVSGTSSGGLPPVPLDGNTNIRIIPR